MSMSKTEELRQALLECVRVLRPHFEAATGSPEYAIRKTAERRLSGLDYYVRIANEAAPPATVRGDNPREVLWYSIIDALKLYFEPLDRRTETAPSLSLTDQDIKDLAGGGIPNDLPARCKAFIAATRNAKAEPGAALEDQKAWQDAALAYRPATTVTFEDWFGCFITDPDKKIADYQRHAAKLGWEAALAHRPAESALADQIEQLRDEYAQAAEGWERCKAECDELRSAPRIGEAILAICNRPIPAGVSTLDGCTRKLQDIARAVLEAHGAPDASEIYGRQAAKTWQAHESAQAAIETEPFEPKPPNETGETTCRVRWMVETPQGWLGAYDKAAFSAYLALAARGVHAATVKELTLPDERIDAIVREALAANPYTNYVFVAQNAAVEANRADKHAKRVARTAVRAALEKGD